MPHATDAYLFEQKVWSFASGLSRQLAGDGYHPFVMLLDPTGAVQLIYFECPEQSWHALTDKLDQAGTSYLFYDPFDAPEYTWLSWSRIDQPTMERFIGNRFDESDFEKDQSRMEQAPDLQPQGQFPGSWGVMF